jgi:hypothetical protein
MTGIKEYLRRNSVVAASCGVCSGIDAIIRKLQTTKRPQKWLLTALDNELIRANRIPAELAKHRDEYKKVQRMFLKMRGLRGGGINGGD